MAKLQQDANKHLANLLASKDPMAFQQVAAMSNPVETQYTGPIIPGDELEYLAAYEAEINKRFG